MARSPEELRAQAKQLVAAKQPAQSSGSSPADLRAKAKALIAAKTSGAPTPTAPENEKEPGFVQSLVQGIASPVLRTVETGRRLAVGTGKLITGDVAGAQKTLTTAPTSYGYFGKIKPVEVKILKTDEQGRLRATTAGEFGASLKDVAGVGAELALLPASGGALVSGVKQTGIQVAKGLTKQAIKTGVKTAVADAALGAATGVAATAQQEGATAQDYAKAALLGGAVGAILPPVAGTGLRVLGKTVGAAGRQVGRVAESVATGLEKVAAVPEIKAGARFAEAKVVPTATQELAGGAAKIIRAAQNLPTVAKEVLTNKYAALPEGARKSIESLKSRIGGQVELQEQKLDTIAKSAGEDWTHTKELMKYLDFQDRLASGQAVEGGQTAQDVATAIQKLQSDIGPERFSKVQNSLTDVQSVIRSEFDRAHASGRIRDESYNAALQKYKNYMPHSVLDYAELEAPFPSGKKLSQKTSGIKKAVGSVRELEDPETAMKKYLQRERSKSLTNEAVGELVAEVEKVPGASTKITPGEIKEVDIPKDKGIISYMKSGIREDHLVPKELADAINNTGAREIFAKANDFLDNTIIGKTLTAPARFLRGAATIFNPVFAAVTNPIRDVQNAAVNTDITFRALANGFRESFGAARGKQSEFYKLAKESGAFGSGYFAKLESKGDIVRRDLGKRGILDAVIDVSKKPGEVIKRAGETMEQMTRLAVFRRAYENGLAKGLDGVAASKAAAEIARNSTVDFTKSGYAIETLNKVFPFLNARVQGLVNIAKTAKETPVNFVRRVMWTAGAPSIVLYAHNQRFDSYQLIPDSEKRKFYVIMYGEDERPDFKGKIRKVPLYLKIPKGDAQAPFASAIERMLNHGQEKYPESTSEFLSSLGTDISPITDANILPEGLRQLVELKSNYSMYRKKQIVPDYIYINNKPIPSSQLEPRERTTRTDSEIAKWVGNAMNWSPAQIDYVIRVGALNDVLKATDIGIKELKGEKGVPSAESLPFIRQFMGSSSFGEEMRKKKFEEQKAIEKMKPKVERLRLLEQKKKTQ